jgi:hypothetical protein
LCFFLPRHSHYSLHHIAFCFTVLTNIYIKLMSEHSWSEVNKQNFVWRISDIFPDTYTYMVPTPQKIRLHFTFIYLHVLLSINTTLRNYCDRETKWR